MKAKSSHIPHLSTRRRVVRIFEIINIDIIGPMSTSREGHIYNLNFIDDFSGFSVVYPLKNRTGPEVLKVFKE